MSVPRIIAFWGLVDFALIITLFGAWKASEITIPKTLLNQGVLAYTCLQLLIALTSVNPKGSFLSSFERMDGFIGLLHLSVFYLIIGNQKFSSKQWSWLAIVAVLVAVVISLYGIKESEYSEDGRIQSILSNPLYVAIYLIFHIYLLLVFIPKTLKLEKKASKVLGLLLISMVLVVFFYVLIYTKSRISILALTLGVSVILILSFVKYTQIRKYVLLIGVFIITSLFFLYSQRTQSWVVGNSALYRITNFSFGESSMSARKELWAMTLEGFSERPITGWGQESFIYFFTKHYSPSLHDNGFWYDRAHNFLLDKYIEGGILGLIGYLIFVVAILVALWSKNNRMFQFEKIIFTGYLTSYLVFNLTVFDNFISLLILFFILCYINQNIDYQSSKWTFKTKPVVFLGLFIFISGFAYFFTIKTYKSYKKWNSAYNSVEFSQFMNNYKEAFDYALIGKYNIGIDFALQKGRIIGASFDSVAKQEYFGNCEAKLKSLLDEYPNHPIVLSQLGFIQNNAGKKQEAIATYELLRKIAPKRQVNLMDLAIFYLDNKDYDKAFVLFDEIYSLDKSYHLTQLYKGYGLALKGDSRAAKDIIFKLPIELIAEKIEFVNDIFSMSDNSEELLKYLSEHPYKPNFNQKTYLLWLRLADKYNNEREVRSALYSYYRHFLPEDELLNINNITEQILKKKTTPDVLSNYFSLNPGK